MTNTYDLIKQQLEEIGGIRKRFDIYCGGKILTQTQYGEMVYRNHIDNINSRKRNMYRAWELQKNKSNYYILKWEEELISKIKGEN